MALKLKAVLYQMERANRAHIMFEMPWLAQALKNIGVKVSNNGWVSAGFPAWQNLIECWNLGREHYQRGHQGEKRSLNLGHGVTVHPEELALLVAEPAFSAIGAIVALLHTATPVNNRYATDENTAKVHQVHGCPCLRRATLV